MKRFALSIGLISALLACIAPAGAADGVSIASGGIGVAEQQQLEARAAEFNLKLVFTLTEGNYVANVAVSLKDARGRTLVDHVADGPFFMARLPAGAYAVQASYNGKTQSRKVSVGERLHTEYFRWPADPEVDFPLPREQAEEAKPRPGLKRG